MVPIKLDYMAIAGPRRALLALAGLLALLPLGALARPSADAAAVGFFPWVRQWYSLDGAYAATAAVTW